MATAAAATPANVLPNLPEAVLHTLFGGTWFGGGELLAPASHARPAHAPKVHAPTPVRSPLPHQLGYDDGEDEAHVHVRLHNMPSGARVSSSTSGATLHIDTGKGAKTHAGSTPSGTGSPGDPAFEIATHQFTGGMAGTSVHPADPHGAGANIAHRVSQKSAPQAAPAPASPWSLDSLLHLPGKLAVSAAAWEGRMADDAVEGVEEKLGLAKPQKPGTARKPGTFEQFNRAYTAAIVGGVEDMVGGLWKTEVYAYQHPVDFYAGIVKRGWDAAKWAVNTDVKILKAGYTAAVESATVKGRRQLWHDGTQAWNSSVKTAMGLYHQAANTIDAARKSGTLATFVGDVAGKIVVNVAPALVGAPEVSAAKIGGSLALKEGVEIGAKTALKEVAEAAPAAAREPELQALRAASEPKIGAAADIYESTRPLAEEFPELEGVNPHYVPDGAKGTNTNCVSCTNAVTNRLLGDTSAVAKATGGYRVPNDLLPTAPFGFESDMLTADAIEKKMLEGGHGAMGAIRIPLGDDYEHAINVINSNGKIHFIDGQSGKIVTLKPDMKVHFGKRF
jgi:hypothetical protein